jgi:hypothetical protein
MPRNSALSTSTPDWLGQQLDYPAGNHQRFTNRHQLKDSSSISCNCWQPCSFGSPTYSTGICSGQLSWFRNSQGSTLDQITVLEQSSPATWHTTTGTLPPAVVMFRRLLLLTCISLQAGSWIFHQFLVQFYSRSFSNSLRSLRPSLLGGVFKLLVLTPQR